MWKVIRRTLLALVALVVAVAAWLSFETYSVYKDASKTYQYFPRTTLEPKATPVTNFFGNHRINFLLLGSDNDRKSEEKHPLTQSMIVVSIDPVHYKVNMLSIPRDFWVPIPGHKYGKIDLAAKYGWVPLARATVERLFHINIDYYAWVGLSGFSSVINDFGGVTINVTHPILDDFYPNDQIGGNPYAYKRIFIPPGWRHLSGRQALEYVRSRHGDAGADFGRSDRQQQVLLQLRKKATGLDLVFKVPQLAHDLRNVVRTDVGTTKLLDVARLVRHIRPSDITRQVLSAPVYCRYAFVNGQNVLIPNWKAIHPVIQRLFAPIQPLPTPSPAPTSTPAPRATASVEHLTTAKPSPHSTTRPTAAPIPPTATPIPPTPVRLPARLIYTAAGTFYEMDRNRNTTDLMPSWMTAADMPALSPDRKTLTFMRWSTYASDLYSYNLQTHKVPTQITNDTPLDPHTINNGVWSAWPAWSSDGKTILYSSDRYKLQQAPSESRMLDMAIYAIAPGGSNLRQITIPAQGAGGDTDAQFLGRSSRFLYVHWAYNMRNGFAVGAPYSQLMVRDLSNPNVSWALSPPSGQLVQPSVDRAGDRLAYVQTWGSFSRLVVADIVTTKNGPQLRHQQVIASGEIAQPALSPDGRWVAYLLPDGDGFSLYVQRTSPVPAVKISEAGTGVDALSRPVWIP